MSSPARMAIASGACGTAMGTMTAVTTVMSSVVSGALGVGVGRMATVVWPGGEQAAAALAQLHLPGVSGAPGEG